MSRDNEMIAKPDRDGRTSLHAAVIAGDEMQVRSLVAAGADVNASDRMGWTPVHFAAQRQWATIAEVLLAAGALVDAEDGHGNTPLSNAVFDAKGRGEVIQLLIRYGADKTKMNKHGVSPASLAATIANYDVKRFL